MTRKELTRNYWRYYRMLEYKFRETIDYRLELHPESGVGETVNPLLRKPGFRS